MITKNKIKDFKNMTVLKIHHHHHLLLLQKNLLRKSITLVQVAGSCIHFLNESMSVFFVSYFIVITAQKRELKLKQIK
jgi:hypothetical protein